MKNNEFTLATSADRKKHQEKQNRSRNLTYMQDVLRRLLHNKAAMLSLIILLLIILISILSIWFSPHNPNKQNVAYAYLPPKIGNGNIPGFTGKITRNKHLVDAYALADVPKKTYFILGTDYLGRDLFSRILYGTRLSLLVAFIATFFDLAIGVSYGIFSGYKGGGIDTFMQRIIEIISSIPTLVVVVLIMLFFKPGLPSIILAIAYSSWATMARLTRADTLKIKNQEYIASAKTLGESGLKIAFKHILPNISSTIIIQTMFTIPTAIFFEAFLSYIGIGIPAPNASLGTLLSDGQQTFRYMPYQMFFPALMICVIMISFNLLGDGLRDAFDPKTEG